MNAGNQRTGPYTGIVVDQIDEHVAQESTLDAIVHEEVLVLASRSPRRRALLNEHGVTHVAVHPGFEDADLLPGEACRPEHWVAALAFLKAWAIRMTQPSAHAVLAADTTCLKDGRLIGTPRDAGEARRMIRGMSDAEHAVITGVAVLYADGRRLLFVDRSRVSVGHLPDEVIDAYIDTEEWRGKAGGYNLRDRIAAGWPIDFEGDETSIMGLPMSRVMRYLRPHERAATSTANSAA